MHGQGCGGPVALGMHSAAWAVPITVCVEREGGTGRGAAEDDAQRGQEVWARTWIGRSVSGSAAAAAREACVFDCDVWGRGQLL